MTITAIPAWNTLGVLPPMDSRSPTSSDRSPYSVSLNDIVMRFSTSAERQTILQGFLNYRLALHDMGLNAGFQWLNGSFMENVETLEKRPPHDIDLVTFFHTPIDFAPSDAELKILTDKPFVKAEYKVDAYLVELDEVPTQQLVSQSAYWYSVWSHRRNQLWKGFLQIDLNPAEDATALALLSSLA
jgi:hypothetical protein